MGLDKTDYVMVAVDVPKDICKTRFWWEDKFEPYVEGQPETMPFQLFHDENDNARFGILVASFSENCETPFEILDYGVIATYFGKVESKYKELFGVEGKAVFCVFSIYA